MKIVHAAAEVFPYAKTGGLADMVGSLSIALADSGHKVSVFLPGYRQVLEDPRTISSARLFSLRKNGGDLRAFSPRKNLTVYLLCNALFFDRSGIYGVDGRDFEDNMERYFWFSKSVVEALSLLKLNADVVHCHDWQTALLPMLLRSDERLCGVPLSGKTVFTVHNMAFQGQFPIQAFKRTKSTHDVPGIERCEHNGNINFLKGGLIFADQVTTVSPQYAREIQTIEFGCGLDEVIALRASILVGLLNGISPDEWDPMTDIHLPAHYSAADINGKDACRKELLARTFFTSEFAGPVFGMVCRLTEQKGIDLFLANSDFFQNSSRCIILGTGENRYEEALRLLSETAPDRICFFNRFDETMSHLIEAGSDFFLMPSLYEPCGLNQMYSQLYGTVPVVSRVGGLFDTVVDTDEQPGAGTGFTFPPTVHGFRDGLDRAITLYADKPRLTAVQQRGMRKNFGWSKAALAYERLYQNSAGTTNDSDYMHLHCPYIDDLNGVRFKTAVHTS